MGRTRKSHFRMAAILLLVGVCVTELAGISRFQKIAKGMGQSAGLGDFMLAEGPLPPPGPSPVPHVRYTVS